MKAGKKMDSDDLLDDWKKLRLSEKEKETKIGFDPQLGSLVHGHN